MAVSFLPDIRMSLANGSVETGGWQRLLTRGLNVDDIMVLQPM